jgi:hypothetical protein
MSEPKTRIGALLVAAIVGLAVGITAAPGRAADLRAEFRDPPREFSVMPFWFWNDRLTTAELVRQIADFEAHGVYGFVIHPRVGLPRDIGWMSSRMMQFMKVAVAEAEKRGMVVVLYDEGMYPSGSSSGQVVARNPAHAARALVKIDLKTDAEPQLEPGWNLVAVVKRPNGQRLAVVDRPSGGVIRGLHYIDAGPGEERPPAADILNPEAVASFISLVYDRYADELGAHFGKTILAVFTDEPSMKGRGGQGLPGTTGILADVNRILGYNFTPYLADLWYEDRPDSLRRRGDYHRAVGIRLEETFYQPLSDWCRKHGIALTGHPAGSMDIGMERYFHIPGQDLVWRYVTPGKTALEGEHSTMAKCASSAMIHLGRRRNSNELYGAYGHDLTFDELQWLANWCFVRGQNLLYPHAFYYSVRGPRRDERPPDVGPNSPWWDRYKPYADACRRLSWLNTDSRHVCEVAILAATQWLPDAPAKVCFEHQRDFNYVELRHLDEDASVDSDGIHLGGMTYNAVILDGQTHLPRESIGPVGQLARSGRLVVWGDADHATTFKSARVTKTDDQLVDAIDALVAPDLTLAPRSKDIRYRHVVKGGRHFYILFSEESETVTVKITVAPRGQRQWWDIATANVAAADADQAVTFQPHELKLLCVGDE